MEPDWKTDPNLLAIKILNRIEKDNVDVTYATLQARAIEKEIDLDIFDRAIERLHKTKRVKQRVVGDEIVYSALPKETKPTKPAKQCLVRLQDGAMVYPLSEFKRENNKLYRLGAVLTPKYGQNTVWFCPSDIGLTDDNLPLPKMIEEEALRPFPEMDLSFMFLSPSELLEYKAAAKGMPAYMMKGLHRK